MAVTLFGPAVSLEAARERQKLRKTTRQSVAQAAKARVAGERAVRKEYASYKVSVAARKRAEKAEKEKAAKRSGGRVVTPAKRSGGRVPGHTPSTLPTVDGRLDSEFSLPGTPQPVSPMGVTEDQVINLEEQFSQDMTFEPSSYSAEESGEAYPEESSSTGLILGAVVAGAGAVWFFFFR